MKARIRLVEFEHGYTAMQVLGMDENLKGEGVL